MSGSLWALGLSLSIAGSIFSPNTAETFVLEADAFGPYVEESNRHGEELYIQHVDNAAAWEFLRENVPLLECPDKELEKIYYFRWWTYGKHIKGTPAGFVVTEPLPAVGWAGKYNTISCPAAHHFYEGRWLHDGQTRRLPRRIRFRYHLRAEATRVHIPGGDQGPAQPLPPASNDSTPNGSK